MTILFSIESTMDFDFDYDPNEKYYALLDEKY